MAELLTASGAVAICCSEGHENDLQYMLETLELPLDLLLTDELGEQSYAVEDALDAGRLSTVRYLLDSGRLGIDAVPELILSDILRHNNPCPPDLWNLLVDIVEGVVGDRRFQYISLDLVEKAIESYESHIAVFLVESTVQQYSRSEAIPDAFLL